MRSQSRKCFIMLVFISTLFLFAGVAQANTQYSSVTISSASTSSFGSSVSVSEHILAVGANDYQTSGGVFVYNCTSIQCVQVAILTSSDATSQFGQAVAVSTTFPGATGAVILVTSALSTLGAFTGPNSGPQGGAAYLFECTPTFQCTKKTEFYMQSEATGNTFGQSIAVSEHDSLVVVGAIGSATVEGIVVVFFCTSTSSCTQTFILNSLSTSGNFGYSVALSGRIVVAGEPGANPDGLASVYDCTVPTNCTGPWATFDVYNYQNQSGYFDSTANHFGTSVSAARNGSIVVVGCPNELYYDNNTFSSFPDAGFIYIFDCSDIQECRLASSFSLPQINLESFVLFGFSTSIVEANGLVLLYVGADAYSITASQQGATFLYDCTNIYECAPGVAFVADNNANDLLGSSISISGDIAVATAPGANTVYVFQCASGFFGLSCGSCISCQPNNTIACNSGYIGSGCVCLPGYSGDYCEIAPTPTATATATATATSTATATPTPTAPTGPTQNVFTGTNTSNFGVLTVTANVLDIKTCRIYHEDPIELATGFLVQLNDSVGELCCSIKGFETSVTTCERLSCSSNPTLFSDFVRSTVSGDGQYETCFPSIYCDELGEYNSVAEAIPVYDGVLLNNKLTLVQAESSTYQNVFAINPDTGAVFPAYEVIPLDVGSAFRRSIVASEYGCQYIGTSVGSNAAPTGCLVNFGCGTRELSPSDGFLFDPASDLCYGICVAST